MKNLIVGFAAVLSNIYAVAQVEPWLELPDLQLIRPKDIVFTDANRGWICNESHSVLTTSNAGVTWESINYQADEFATLQNPEGQSIYLLSYRGKIRKTFDNGLTWTEVQCPAVYGTWDMSFPTLDTGYVSCIYSLKKTMDGGNTWSVVYSNNNYEISKVTFVSTNEGWIEGYDSQLGSEAIRHTDDGGLTWQDQITPAAGNGTVMAQVFTSSQTGFQLVGNTIVKTVDGGNTWTETGISADTSWLQDICFPSFLTGYAVGTYGKILKTTDGGTTWSNSIINVPGIVPFSTNVNLMAVEFIDDQNGWIAADGLIFSTSDGGLTWNNQLAQSPGQLAISVDSSGNNIIAVSRSGMILHSDDSGLSWNTVLYNNDAFFLKTCFSSENDVWAIGTHAVYHSSDTGHTWLPNTNFQNNSLTDIQFLNQNTGYFLQGSNLMKTSNGGGNWLAIQPDSQNNQLIDLFFISEDTGWVTTVAGVVFRTQNGGTSWEMQANLTNSSYAKVFFLDSQIGWVYNVDNILKTTDGGLTWIPVNPPPSSQIREIVFSSELSMMLSSDNGLFLTSDGGQTWAYRQENWQILYNFVNAAFGSGIYAISDQGLIYEYHCDNVSTLINYYVLPSTDTNNCEGILQYWLNGGSDFQVSIDGGTIQPYAPEATIDSICPGMHELIIQNTCSGFDTILFIMPTDTDFLSIDPNWQTTGIPTQGLDSLGATIEDCSLDYATIDTAYIYESWPDADTVIMVWGIHDTNGIHFDTVKYFLTSGNGDYWFQLGLYCTTKSIARAFVVSQVGPIVNHHSGLNLNEGKPFTMNVFPNPVVDYMRIDFPVDSGTLTIYDLQGNLLKQMNVISNQEILMSDLSMGVYLLEFRNAGNRVVQRIIKN